MNEIKIKGKVMSFYNSEEGYLRPPPNEITEAEILISPPSPKELAKLKEGDEVLVRMKFKDFLLPASLIAILPPENQEYCKCVDSDIINEIKHCNACGKPLPEKQDKEIEEFSLSDYIEIKNSSIQIRSTIVGLIEKINELIQIINQRK